MPIYRNSSIDWKPSPVVALATSADDSQVAAAREDGSLEIWLVSPGTAGWHCQLTVHGDPKSRISSLVWCHAGKMGLPGGRLFSSSIDGSVSEWDLYDLKQKIVLQSIDFSIWQMAVAPSNSSLIHAVTNSDHIGNGYLNDKSNDSVDHETSESENENDSDLDELHEQSVVEDRHVALACDDGCVRVYRITDSDELIYHRSLPRVGGRVLSVTWSADGDMLYSGSSDGFIRSWNAKLGYEIYRITVGLGGLGSGPELCIWSLLSLRCGTLVSADSTGSVQFWDSRHGTLLQAHSFHKGDVNTLAAAPSHNRVFSAGSDGQVILYKASCESIGPNDDLSSSEVMKKWVYVGSVRAHTHDVRALTVAVPISREDPLPDDKVKRRRGREKPIDFSYHKWAHLGVPMLISAGDDTKLYAYCANEFTKFSPHEICPAPQRVPIHMVHNTILSHTSLLLVQYSCRLDILSVRLENNVESRSSSGGQATTSLLVQVKSKASRKIICSTISNSGMLFAYSDHVTPSLFELKRGKIGQSEWTINKRQLRRKLPFAHSMIFSYDSSRLIIAGHDRRIYVVDVSSSELIHTFTPCHEEHDKELPPSEPPITKMFTSSDGQWLAAVNCFGDVYIFNLEIQRQHWFISRLDGASVAAAGFPPQNNNVLIITTSSNQVYVFDVEAKQLGEWSMQHTFVLPRRYQEFPGEVIGLSFSPSPSSSSVIIYSARAMCVIDFGRPVDQDDETDTVSGQGSALRKISSTPINGRLKRKLRDCQTDANKLHGRKNFEFFAFRDPVLFIGHLSKSSMLIIDKPWLEMVKIFDAPVHRHIYGT